MFLIPSLGGGGAEKTASILIPLLAKQFDLVTVLLNGPCVYSLPSEIKLTILSPQTDSPLKHIFRIPYHIKAVIRMVRKTQIDGVLSFMEQANIINILAAFLTGHNIYISQRTNPIKQYEYKGLLGRLIMGTSKYLYRRARGIFCVSREICSILEEIYHIPRKRLHFIPNPVDTSPIDIFSVESLDLPSPFILQVGRLNIRTKAQDVTLRAFKKVLKEVPHLNLVFAGKGPDLEKLRQLAEELGIHEKVFFVGWIKDPRALMLKASVLVLTSRYEGWPNVLTEALWCGCPVIATDCETGPREILLDGKCGLLIPTDDVSGLKEAIVRLLTDDELQKRLVTAGLKRAQDFVPESIAQRYVELMESYEE